jgi:hypothetical protein
VGECSRRSTSTYNTPGGKRLSSHENESATKSSKSFEDEYKL